MARKPLTSFQARVTDSAVRLSAYKSTPTFQDKQASTDPFRTIRVYRKDEADFVFGEDYAEYFDGLSWREARVVFEGTLPAENERKFTYVDHDVQPGDVYAYWIAASEGEPTGPAPVKVRDPEVWWSRAKIEETLADLEALYPETVRVESIGRTVRGQNIKALRVGNGKRAVGLVGAVHAGEAGAELMLPAIGHILAEHGDLLSRVGIAAVPVVNLDERERLVHGVPWYLRTNSNGVDLNRNFPADWETVALGYGLDSSDSASPTYRGAFPCGEPETQAVTAFFRNNPVEILFSFHCLASICGMHFLAPICGKGNTAYAERCGAAAMIYGAAMAPDLRVTEEQVFRFGTTSGSLPAWCCKELCIPAFDIEISAALEPEALAQCRIDKTDAALLEQYQQRHSRGLVAILAQLAMTA